MAIWITQWLCPSRHCSIALLWDDQKTTAAATEQKGEEIYTNTPLNRHCGICSETLTPEAGQTRFTTMSEALPHFQQLEEENALARTLLGGKF